MDSVVDNLSDSERERGKKIRKARKMLDEGFKLSEIAETLGVSIKTVVRYRTYDPTGKRERCRRYTELNTEQGKERVLQLIKEGWHISEIYRTLNREGLHVSRNTVAKYSKEWAAEEGLELSHNGKSLDYKAQKNHCVEKTRTIYVRRKDVMSFLWSGTPLDVENIETLYEAYPAVRTLKTCIEEFRSIFDKRNLSSLHHFIEKYENSPITALKSFIGGLERDQEAVENAVTSDYSNGPIEGTNNKIKMVKRTMYGRCSTRLLKAKLMYEMPG